MKSLLKGLASFPHILTEEDVLRHSYGIEPGDAPVVEEPKTEEPVVDVPKTEEPVVEEPVVEEPVVEEPVVEEPKTEEPKTGLSSDSQLSDADYAEKLERENTKAVLVSMAEAAGVDSGGNKAELAARLAARRRAK